jgi:hypothetical protein
MDNGMPETLRGVFEVLHTEWIIAGVCCLVLLYILGRVAKPLVYRILRGLIFSGIVSLVLVYIFHVSTETVFKIGAVVFLLTAIFGPLPRGMRR